MPDEDWEPEEADRSKRVWGFVGIGVLCAALLAGAIWLTLRVISAPPPAALVAVPDLSGMTLEEATAQLRDSRLTLGTVTPTESSDENKDRVVNQRPSSQTQVAQDSAVNLEIGKGVSLVGVPNVVSYTPEEAKRALNEANLQYEEVPQSSSDADKGKALAQDPAPQAQVAPGTRGQGDGRHRAWRRSRCRLDIVGKSLEEATALLTAAKLQVVSTEADGVEPANQVLQMSPAAGERVQEGTPVQLTVSNNALMVMPRLVNQSPNQAVGTLQQVGWGGDAENLSRREQETTNPGQVGAVLSQSPGGRRGGAEDRHRGDRGRRRPREGQRAQRRRAAPRLRRGPRSQGIPNVNFAAGGRHPARPGRPRPGPVGERHRRRRHADQRRDLGPGGRTAAACRPRAAGDGAGRRPAGRRAGRDDRHHSGGDPARRPIAGATSPHLSAVWWAGGTQAGVARRTLWG